ncbi:MAG: 2-phospho-L-lactate transferase [Candidatus Hodarchaeota archaeon]
MVEDYYVILAGGVGAAKFIDGLAKVIDPELLKIIINTGDDIELFGLKICPDIDIITYTLANLIDKEKGWGFIDESFNCLRVLKNYYDDEWFNAGDKDLATHIYRTDLFNKGFTKAEITSMICNKLGVKSHLIPMCNEDVQTFIKTPSKSIHFEEYYIKYQCEPEIMDIEFIGIENAKLIEGVLDYIKECKRIIICPSNPIVSIGTILNVAGIRVALRRVRNRVFGISPIIQGSTVKGPADKLMRALGLNVSCVGVAKYYKDFLGNFIIDNRDSRLKSEIENFGIKTYCYDTIMSDETKKKDLAKFIINL